MILLRPTGVKDLHLARTAMPPRSPDHPASGRYAVQQARGKPQALRDTLEMI